MKRCRPKPRRVHDSRTPRLSFREGRGLGGAENWHNIDDLAEILGAAVGASRAVTEPAGSHGPSGGTYRADDCARSLHHGRHPGRSNTLLVARALGTSLPSTRTRTEHFQGVRYGVVGDYKAVLPAFTKRVRELMDKAHGHC